MGYLRQLTKQIAITLSWVMLFSSLLVPLAQATDNAYSRYIYSVGAYSGSTVYSPFVFNRLDLRKGSGLGTQRVALVKSFYDPYCKPQKDSLGTVYPYGANYEDIATTNRQYRNDVNLIKNTSTGLYMKAISDRLNQNAVEPPDKVAYGDGIEDGTGDLGAVYDCAMAVIALVNANKLVEARQILDTFSKEICSIMIDGEPVPPLNHPKDQKELWLPLAHPMIQFDFSKYKDTGSVNETFDATDAIQAGYPRMAPMYEFGIFRNDPWAWCWVDKSLDMPRTSEFNDAMDTDPTTDPLYSLFPYYEDEYYFRLGFQYLLWPNLIDSDSKIIEGADLATDRIWPDRVVSYSQYDTAKNWKFREWFSGTGDALWMVLAMLYYTDMVNDTQYVAMSYRILDTIADNLQDFNGGLHFGYYGPMELMPESTEHNLDWMMVWNYIEKLYKKGLVDSTHYSRYAAVTNGNLTLATTDIAILSVSDNTQDDNAVIGAQYMMKHMGLDFTTLSVTTIATTLTLGTTKVIILPETPYSLLNIAVRTIIENFAKAGGKVFGTCRAAVGSGSAIFGVQFTGTQAVTNFDRWGRNIVVSQVYKDGVDNVAEFIDANGNGLPEDITFPKYSENMLEPPTADSWEESSGMLTYCQRASIDPMTNDFDKLFWQGPDYKRSRLVYYLHDQGDGEFRTIDNTVVSTMNGGHSPEFSKIVAGTELRTNNSGHAILAALYATTPTVTTANDYNRVPMLLCKTDVNGPTTEDVYTGYVYTDAGEFLYFNKPTNGTSTGKAVFMRADIFSMYKNVCDRGSQATVWGTRYFNPYKYQMTAKTSSQILENALTWFFSANMEPYYTVREPYEVTWVKDEGGKKGEPPWSGYMGSGNGWSLGTIDERNATAPQRGSYCTKVTRVAGESWCGAYIQKDGTWNGSNGGGANLTGATSLTFYAKGDGIGSVKFGVGQAGDTVVNREIGPYVVPTVWTKYTIPLTGYNVSMINGLFYFVFTNIGANTLYIDNVHFQPERDNLEAQIAKGELSPTLWRDKGTVHLGVSRFLERAVWCANSATNSVRRAPGCDMPQATVKGAYTTNDYLYENPDDIAYSWQAASSWPTSYYWMRGQQDWSKAMDTVGSWGSYYWLEKANLTNAAQCFRKSESLFRLAINGKDGFEYWDNSCGLDTITLGKDDYGEGIWPEGMGQQELAYGMYGETTNVDRYLATSEAIAYTFPDGTKGVPYNYNKANTLGINSENEYNMITDIGTTGTTTKVYAPQFNTVREDSLSMAATAWTHLAKEKARILAKADWDRSLVLYECINDNDIVGWTTQTGTWAAYSNTARQSGALANTNMYYNTGKSAGTGDSYFSWTLYGETGNNASVYMFATAPGNTNRGTAYRVRQTPTSVVLSKIVSDVETTMGTYSVAIATGTTVNYAVKMSPYDRRIRVYRNNAQILNIVDSVALNTSGTYVCLRTDASVMRFDNVIFRYYTGMFDDFISTSDLWTPAAGSWSVSGGYMYQSSSTTVTGLATHYAPINAPWGLVTYADTKYTDELSYDLYMTSGNRDVTTYFMCSTAPTTTAEPTYGYKMQQTATQLIIYKIQASVATVIKTITLSSALSTSYPYKIVANYRPNSAGSNGLNIEVYRSGVLVGYVFDISAPCTTNYVAFKTANTAIRLDNIKYNMGYGR